MIGERIKKRRVELDKTQEWLADRSKTTRQTIHRYETGEISNIPSDRIELIADALQTSPAFLMGWTDFRNKKEFELEIQKINMTYMFQHLVNSDESIISFFKYLFEKEYINSKMGDYNSSFYYFHSFEELVVRYQDLYLKKDLIRYEEQKELSRSLYLDCYDLSDYNLRFSLQDIIDFLDNPTNMNLYKDEDWDDISINIFYSCIESERHIRIFNANNDIDENNSKHLLARISTLLESTNARFVKLFPTELEKFLNISYTPVHSYISNNFDDAEESHGHEINSQFENKKLLDLFNAIKKLEDKDLDTVSMIVNGILNERSK